jgi:hypothetical protein
LSNGNSNRTGISSYQQQEFRSVCTTFDALAIDLFPLRSNGYEGFALLLRALARRSNYDSVTKFGHKSSLWDPKLQLPLLPLRSPRHPSKPRIVIIALRVTVRLTVFGPLPSPPLAPSGGNFEVKPATVKHLDRFLAGLGISDSGIGQANGGNLSFE